MRVLFLTNRYPPFYTGGYEIVCQAIADKLRERGHEVLVLTSNYGLRGTRTDGHVQRLLHRTQDSASLWRLARWEFHDNRLLRARLRDWQPDVVYAWSLLQLFPSLHKTLQQSGVPVVFAMHDVWLPLQLEQSRHYVEVWSRPGANLLKKGAKRLLRAGFERRDPDWLRPLETSDLALRRIVFCSDFQRDLHRRAGLPLETCRVIYNGIDFARFCGAPPPINGSLKVLFVGRLVPEKGAHLAIEALRHLQQAGIVNVTLSLAGVPTYPLEYAKSLTEMVNAYDLGDRVLFLGSVPNAELPEIYRQHQVLVFPSSHIEGLPMTLLEAMACGVTVISTVTGGSCELLEDGENCYTVPERDASALARQLQRVLNNPEEAQALARAAQQNVRRRFDLEAIAMQTEEYLQAVVERRA